jgi:type I restriction enzyme S subunit
MGDWKECKLGEVAEIVGGGTPKTKESEYWNGEIAWLTPRDLSNFNGRYISKGERNISKLGLAKSSAKILPKGVVLLSSRAPVGYLAIAKNEVSTNQGFRNLISNSETNNLFLFYLLKNNVEYLKSQSTGTTFGELAGSTLKSLSFYFPPLTEQKAIASVLSSLDDKIDLLHRQNKTLEAMGETLFRQWFVEEANEDWEEGCLGDVIELVYGKGLKKEIRTGTGYPVIGSSGVVGYHSEFLVEGPGIVIGRKGTLGKVIYLWDNFFPIDTTYYIKSKAESAGLLYEYFLLKTLNFEEMNSDSAVPGLNRDIALSTEIEIAPLEKF